MFSAPAVVFVVFSVLSLVGLGRAMRTIPTGTAYAVWTGVGALLTVLWAAVTGTEPLSVNLDGEGMQVQVCDYRARRADLLARCHAHTRTHAPR